MKPLSFLFDSAELNQPTIFYPGVADQSKATVVTVKEGEQIALEDFRSLHLLKERWFSGVVLNADKTPATNAVARLHSCRGFILEAKTDEFGRFRLKGFETYEYEIDPYTERKQGQVQIFAKPLAVPKDGKVDEIQILLGRSRERTIIQPGGGKRANIQ